MTTMVFISLERVYEWNAVQVLNTIWKIDLRKRNRKELALFRNMLS